MKKLAFTTAAAVAIASFSGAANAGVSLSTSNNDGSYACPCTYDFDGNDPATAGGGIVGPGTTSGQFAAPLNGSGKYFSVGPSTDTPGTVSIANPNGINWIEFIWGSVDTYNSLAALGTSFTVVGGDLPPADGSQGNAVSNPIVRLTFSGSDAFTFNGLKLSSTSNAFEIDSIKVNAVPEPATWALMILGFGFLGGALRSRSAARRRATSKLSFAS